MKHVHLLGRVNAAEITPAFDIATSCSFSGEGFSNAIGEAMASGVPCVVTDIGDSALIVGDTGKVVPDRVPDKLAAAWAELLDMSPGERRDVGLAARNRIVSNFSLDIVVKQYESLYQDIYENT